ncbi:hypothetical protein ScPMuIL_013123 [Solemya velum]
MASEVTSLRGKSGGSWPKVYLLGNSITQFSFSAEGGWGSLIADHLQRKCDVVCRGFSGYNSRWWKIILPKVLTASDVKDAALITLFLGANDSVLADLGKAQHVPLEEFQQNMSDIVIYLQSIGVAREKIIIISPPACAEEKWRKECEEKGRIFSKCNKQTGEYAQACANVAKLHGTGYVHLYTEMMKVPDWDCMLNDGLHLSADGASFVFKLLKPLIDNLTCALPMRFPDWKDIDNKNPHAVLDQL